MPTPPPTITIEPDQNTDSGEVVRYGHELQGATPDEKNAQYESNWRHAEAAVKQGKAICISDLMAQACQVTRKPSAPRGKLARALAAAKS